MDEEKKKPDEGTKKERWPKLHELRRRLQKGFQKPQEPEQQPKQYRVIGSFRVKMVVSFVVVALLTALLIIFTTLLAFDSYLRGYSVSNIDVISEYVASAVENSFHETESFDSIDLVEIRERLELGEDVGVLVKSGSNIIVASWPLDSQGREVDDMGFATHMVSRELFLGSSYSGTLDLWLNGTDTLVGRFDVRLRNDTVRAMTEVGFAAVLIASVLGLLFSLRLARPVRLIANAARRINRGDLKARSNVVGNNEVGKLGESFDAMAVSIERDRNLEMRLTSDVAHELRTPLMAIQCIVEAMIDGMYDVTPEKLGLIDSEVQRLSRLVDAMLRLSRLERRSEPMRKEVCDLSAVVRAVYEANEMLAHERGLDFKLHIVQDSKVVCDSDMIRQAVSNLVSNSLRYTSEGEIDLYVRRESTMAAIDVSDTGIGLDPDEEKMVFSRFWRSEASRSRESGGLGIGLAVVKEIVDRHGGKVTVNGKKGTGSTFTIFLPRYDAELESKRTRQRRGFSLDEGAKAGEAKDGAAGDAAKKDVKGGTAKKDAGADAKGDDAKGGGDAGAKDGKADDAKDGAADSAKGAAKGDAAAGKKKAKKADDAKNGGAA